MPTGVSTGPSAVEPGAEKSVSNESGGRVFANSIVSSRGLAAADADARTVAAAGLGVSTASASAALNPALKERMTTIGTELKGFFGLCGSIRMHR